MEKVENLIIRCIDDIVDNDNIVHEIMTRNLIFDILNFDYFYTINKNSPLYDIGILSISINFELNNGKYEVKSFHLLVDLKFLNIQNDTLNIIVIDNIDNLTGIFQVNNCTYFNINMENILLESIKINSIEKLTNYINNGIKVKDFICFLFDYGDLDISKYYSNISTISYLHTKIRFDIAVNLDMDLLNIILVLKRLYESLVNLTKSTYNCGLSIVICNDMMFNFESEALKIHLKKLLKYFDYINFEYFMNSKKEIYTFDSTK